MSLIEETKYFFELTPEKILTAVERTGLRCTGRILSLNSMENRVYEVEIVVDEDSIKSVSEKFRVAKFYRPGRWTEEQILDEHRFLLDLQAQDIPVVAPLPFDDGRTVKKIDEAEIYFAVFPKCGGRIPQEFDDEQLQIIGRLMARMHNIGASRKAEHRIVLSQETYGINNLKFLIDSKLIPPEYAQGYKSIVEQICAILEPAFARMEKIRIHGDCHLANILWGRDGPFLVDFDDMLVGPPVQDVWLILPGRDEEAQRQLQVLVDAYETMRRFDRQSLSIIEGLRALRIIHFAAWIGKRWQDPSFQRAFLDYGTDRYWQEHVGVLREQLSLLQ